MRLISAAGFNGDGYDEPDSEGEVLIVSFRVRTGTGVGLVSLQFR
jgi:hypothetical protein